MQHSISVNNDSVFIKGLQNTLLVEIPDLRDSLQYRLEGLETKIQNSPYPIIRYTNLEGGQYSLYYKAKNEKSFKTIHIQIEEAIWQKWWFLPMIAFYVLLLTAVGIYFFSLHNFRQKMKVQLMRNKISADLHDEVGSNLSSIAIYTQVLRKSLKNPELLPLLDKITNNSKESVQLMQDTVWSLNPSNDSVEKLLERIKTYGQEILSNKNIGFQQDITIDISKIKLDMEDRKNLYLILKEGLNNIAKHANASKAALSVFGENDKIIFSLADNGDGFDIKVLSEGNGLRNFKERAEESNFMFKINTQIEKGTTLRLEIRT